MDPDSTSCDGNVDGFTSVVEPKLFVSAPAPAPTLALTYLLSQISYLKCGFFMFFMKEYQPNSHAGFYTK
jgi:hypothetical protein